ncbi:Ca2+-binding protein, RTX toxin-related [Octadecabacter temperatus]|uniref:Bifunctional hemolysin/adenylate cyclase n=1 Tax=Octadecabacter temperatus TaxID=1458307 RepID=A0A0K0Y8D6_9RHOB|nr:calcium-binding protein [Octadecabacter temperatus]AKS47137.1 Bifunctional hemolysin/adenylate cyclase precursor [Octadecabacter temperatus]SIO46095.1 Ca2+-binding protein, RTX toxin-related [Octadecabacter temperatus]
MARNIYGTSESDTIEGGAGPDHIYGKSGDDNVVSSSSADEVFGQSGEDTIDLGGGADKGFAGSGDDFVDGSNGSDSIFGGSGNDLLLGGDVSAGAASAEALGGVDDYIWGGTGEDDIFGQSGNDRLLGQADDDLVSGEEGSDYMFGGGGKDVLFGGTGNDVAYGGSGNDNLSGENGVDYLFGGANADVLSGGTGGDVLNGDGGDDLLLGEEGSDLLNAGRGHDQAFGGAANDTINLFEGNDFAVGGAGEDQIRGGVGNDIIYGDYLPENLLSDDGESVGRSVAQFEGTDWVVTNDSETGQTSMTQTVDTDADKSYVISVDVAANFAGGFVSGAIEVLWNGVVIDTVQVDSGAFETLTYEVSGVGDGTGISIRTAESDGTATSIYDTSGPIITYEKTVDLGDGAFDVAAFAPGQAKLFQVISGQLQIFDTETQTYTSVGSDTGFKINAIGFNAEDDLIYGYARSNGVDALGNPLDVNSLIMMDATGQVYRLGDGSHPDFVGDFDAFGNLWTFHSTLDRATMVDVDDLDEDGNPRVETFEFPAGLVSSNIYDIAYNHENNLFYGVVAPNSSGNAGSILVIDMNAVSNGGVPVVSEIPIIQSLIEGETIIGMPQGAFGAVFMDGLGNLYAGLNSGDHDLDPATENSGGVYLINIDDTGQFATAELISSAQSTGNNDGAMDPRGNDPFADIDATADVLVNDITVSELEGAGWDDTISAGAGDDIVHGGGLDDLINGGIGNDQLFGEAGFDTLYGLDGADQLDGGSGNDKLHGGAGDDVVLGGAGGDTLYGESGLDALQGGSGNDVIYGGAGNDDLTGGNGNDVLWGGAADDSLFGGRGNDTLSGNSGEDHLEGGRGNDHISGNAGADDLSGESGNDILLGGSGDDILSGNNGNDELFGGEGADVLYGGAGRDAISGGANGDHLFGGGGQDQLDGGSGADEIYGGAGSDTISGGAGVDVIEAGTGNNEIQGGGGGDAFVFLSSNGTHHDTILDHQFRGATQDLIDLSDFGLLDVYANTEAWAAEHVSVTNDGGFFVQLGYGQSITLYGSVVVDQGDLDTFYSTLIL